MARALAAAIAVSLLAASGAGGAGAQTPKRGGTLVVARPGLSCLNPFGPCALGAGDHSITQVLEGAFERGPDLVFRPNLVSRVEIGKKPFTLTYHIRPEARWSDGVPVTASDFRFTHEKFVDPQQRARVLNAADAKLARAVPVLPVVQPVLRAALRTTVRGFVPGGSTLTYTQNSEDWWLAERR